MDYSLMRERRRLIEDLINLQYEEDLLRQYQTIINHKKLERHRVDCEDNGYRDYHHRRKEYCLIRLTYRHSNTRRRQHADEIMIIQHNHTVFKGCLQYGAQLTFKSNRYRNESKLRLKFYINNLFEEEMIACCEHGLINRNRQKHLFQIEDVIGAKPCYECQSDSDTSTPSSATSDSLFRENSFTKVRIPSPTVLPKGEKSRFSIPSTNNDKASSEGFFPNVREVIDSHTPLRVKSYDAEQSDEDMIQFLPTERQSLPKKIYGPPQISTMISITESIDLPSPTIREQTTEKPLSNIRQTSVNDSNSKFSSNETELNLFNSDNQYRPSQSSTTENNTTDQGTSMSVNSSNNIAIANDATQLLLSQLGIMRQQQVEHTQASSSDTPREKGNVENFILVYLNSSNPDQSTIQHFRSLVNFIKIFNDIYDCVAFINSISIEKIILILSNTFSTTILPKIDDLQQIFSIYILSENEDDSSFNQSKIQGLYTNLNQVYEHISDSVTKITRDLINYLNLSSNATTLAPFFTNFQLLSEIIRDTTTIGDGLKDLIQFSRQEYDGNDEELKLIDEFEKTYQKNQAIYWFSRQCFLSKILHKVFRTLEVDILFKFRLFITDLCQQIVNESTPNSLTVYLAQTIHRSNLDDIQKNILDANLLAFPHFLSGSTDQSRAVRIAKDLPTLSDDYIPLIIRIDIPENSKCANTSSRRYLVDDDNDVLLNSGIMGRIVKVEKENSSEDQIASIQLTLVKCENQSSIQQILEIKRAEIKSFSSFIGMIKLMILMRQQTYAEQMVETMFNDDTLKIDTFFQSSLAAACHTLATSHRDQGDYKRAVELYLLSMDTFIRIIPANSAELSILYSHIATMYFRLDDYEKSHDYHQKALDLQLHSNNPDLYSISVYTNSIGVVHLKQGKYPEAIKSFERTLKILHQLTEPHEDELSLTYDNLGDAYLSQGKIEEALANYTKSLEIQEHMVPRTPSALGSAYYSMGNLYLKIGRSKEALFHLKRALEYQQEYLPLTHSSFALLYNNIGLMYYRQEDYSEALKYYSKSLEIASISLPENHSIVGITLFNTALVYSSEDKLEEAIDTIEKSTAQFLKTLPPDHPDVVENRIYLESIKRKKFLKETFDEDVTRF